MSQSEQHLWRGAEEGDRGYAKDVIEKYSSEGVLSEEQKQEALGLIDSQGPKQAVEYVAKIVESKDGK